MVDRRVRNKEYLHLLHLKALVRADHGNFKLIDLDDLPEYFTLCVYEKGGRYTIKVGQKTTSYDIGERRSITGSWYDQVLVGIYDTRDKGQLTRMVNDTLAVQKWVQEGIASFWDG